ncbi:MAG: (2Fe-2S)-binding protein [Spirochaetales bacterium]|nr:(2Fe-2S)-binding protein [Spirochaetales bacterium]
MRDISFTLNGGKVKVITDPSSRLLDILREQLGLTAVKEGCGEGECGACSVLKNGKLVNSCLVPMGSVQDTEISTLEGIRDTDEGKCIIDSFAESGAVQCGFCTPGMVMAAAALLREIPKPDEMQIRKALSGNLCRCTGYNMIINGIQLAAKRGDGIW